MRAFRIEKGHKLDIGQGRATAIVMNTREVDKTVWLQLREEGKLNRLWVGVPRNTVLSEIGKVP